jgi:hypothetical protein
LKIAVCQPTYLPWLGYFDLIDQVDAFVLLDTVQFEKQSWQQRNRIKTPTGLQWLTVPVMFRGRLGQQILEVEIRDPDFVRKHLRAVELNYRRAPFFETYFPELSQILQSCSSSTFLVDLNIRIIRWLNSILGIRIQVLRSSQLNEKGRRSQLLVNICRALSADSYLSPLGSSTYLLDDLSLFSHADIKVAFQHYEHPQYRQLFPPFVSHASVLDLTFNEGPAALEIIRCGRGRPWRSEELSLHQTDVQTEAATTATSRG